MADSGSFFREQFVCSVCLDLFTRPVTLPCGHNFCLSCITQAWDVSAKSCCPLCKELFTTRPELRVNTMLSETSAALKRRGQRTETSADQTQDTEHAPCVSQRHLQERACAQHERGLELFCRADQSLLCQLCAQTDHRGHMVVPVQTEFEQQRETLERSLSELSRRMEAVQRKTQLSEENLSAICDEASTETDSGVRLFTTFAQTAENILSALLEDIESRQRVAEQRLHSTMEQVRAEMAALRKTKANLEDLGRTKDPLDFLKRFKDVDLDHREEGPEEVSVQVSLEGVVRSAVERLHTELNSELQKLSVMELRSIQKFVVDVCLDPDTAHSALLLSDDCKGVHCGDAKQDLPYSASRFTDSPCILSTPLHQHSSKLYYEVQVKGKTRWYLGVAKESMQRRGQVAASPSAGLWAIWLKGGREYRALDEPAVPLVLGRGLERVGVFVDRSKGLVRFYNADSAERIYTFTECRFTEELRAFFGPCSNDGGKNASPLVITAVRKRRSMT